MDRVPATVIERARDLARLAAAVTLTAMAVGCGVTPEGGPIVYQSPHGLAIVDSDGASDLPLLAPSFAFDGRHADWSRDGTRIAFVAEEPDGTVDVWVADADGSNPEQLVDCAPPCQAADDPAWAPDGATIAYTTYDVVDGRAGGVELMLVDLATGKTRAVASTARSPKIGLNQPRWSPDGRRLVVSLPKFSSTADDGRFLGSALGVVELGLRVRFPRVITPWASKASYPDWHPTKDLIVFQAGSEDPFTFTDTSSNLFTIRPDGTDLRRLTSRGSEKPWIALPAWSPDGEEILVTLVHGLGDHTLATMAADGDDLTEIVDSVSSEPVLGAHSRQAVTQP